METNASNWVILTARSSIFMGYVYVYDSTETNTEWRTEHTMLPWCTGATEDATENIALAMPVGHAMYIFQKAMHFRSNDVHKTKKKKMGLWINEFKPHESFDHFMLLVMRAYVMRTQYGRKNSLFQQTFWCCAWTQTSNISRSFHTECLVWRKLLALF